MDKKELSEYFRKLGRKGAKARLQKVSPEERQRIASEAAKARWSQRKKEGASC
jgi:hypothetical protein